MDWGIDPDRVADIMAIASSRRFSARDTEKFVLAVTGGASENADMPLWDMLQVLFCLGVLTAGPRLPPRDAAIACLLDESEILLRPLRKASSVEAELAGARASASAEGVLLVGAGGKERNFSWSRVRRALGLADFLFAAEGVEGRPESGTLALRGGLDLVFQSARFDDDCLKSAVQEAARFMRAWRRAYLPLLAFADMIRQREAFLKAAGRRDRQRSLDPDDLVAFWSFALFHGETWSFGRFAERFSALVREERAGVGRRDFLAPLAIDDLKGREPSQDPEEALVAWLDREADRLEQDLEAFDEVEDEAAEPDEEQGGVERVSLALLRLPAEPKLVNKAEREIIGRALALLPLAHEQPLTLARARAVAPWENRLVEASRRGADSQRGQVDVSPEPFDYGAVAGELATLGRRFDELMLIGMALGGVGGPDHAGLAAEGGRLLKRWRHDRASFRMEDAKLAQIFARHGAGLRTVASALHRIVRQQRYLGESIDLAAQAERDQARFDEVFRQRYEGRTKRS